MHTVFISYSSEDKVVAFRACKALEDGGVTCWIAPRDLMTGRPDRGQISEAIRRARALVLVLSRKSDRSRQVLWEVERAAQSRLHITKVLTVRLKPNRLGLSKLVGVAKEPGQILETNCLDVSRL